MSFAVKGVFGMGPVFGAGSINEFYLWLWPSSGTLREPWLVTPSRTELTPTLILMKAMRQEGPPRELSAVPA